MHLHHIPQGFQDAQPSRVIVVAWNDDHGIMSGLDPDGVPIGDRRPVRDRNIGGVDDSNPCCDWWRDPENRLPFPRFGARFGGAHEAGNSDNLGEHPPMLVQARAVANSATDVPVCSVKEFHELRFVLTSFKFGGGSSCSSTRVAQAGMGKRTGTGVGMSGCETIIRPEVRIVARWRRVGVRKPYSARSASAASRRPTMRKAGLATMRRSTSEAVCCAPIRMVPLDRPRSAISSSRSRIGDQPSRGA